MTQEPRAAERPAVAAAQEQLVAVGWYRSSEQQRCGTGEANNQRRYPTSKDRSGGREQIPHLQGKEQRLRVS